MSGSMLICVCWNQVETGSGLTKVCQFELSSLVDQQVLWFQVSMENFSPMTVWQTTQQLEKKELGREKPHVTEKWQEVDKHRFQKCKWRRIHWFFLFLCSEQEQVSNRCQAVTDTWILFSLWRCEHGLCFHSRQDTVSDPCPEMQTKCFKGSIHQIISTVCVYVCVGVCVSPDTQIPVWGISACEWCHATWRCWRV